MLTFDRLYSDGHEEVIFYSDPSCGLKAIIAIHDTTLGPALGGTRMYPYKNEDDAIEDVLRLSRGMTYKASISGLNLGGGKAVIIADPQKQKSEPLFRSFGRFIESLNGRYITAQDINITVQDIEHIYTETKNVTGVAKIHGGSGNPAPYTALGVFRGMEACLTKSFGDRSVKNKVVAIQGVGAVGLELAKILDKGGAKIVFTDVSESNISRMREAIESAEFAQPEEIFAVPCDVFAPCAMGAVMNEDTISKLKAKIVCGAANNQLKENSSGLLLKNKGILYAPDYLINAGGLMNVSIEFEGWNDGKSRRMIDTIYETTLKILKLSDEQGIPANEAADLLAEKRINDIRNIKLSYVGNFSHRFPGRKFRTGR